MIKIEQKKKNIALPIIIAIICISFSAIFVKWSHAPATIISMYRMVFASILILPFVWIYRKEFKKLVMRDWLFLCFAGLFLALHFGLWFGSLKLTTVASSTIILTLQPVVALIGGFILYKERTSKTSLLFIGIAIIGAVMIGWGDLAISKQAIIGDILSFLSVVAVVGYLLIGQSIVRNVSHWIYSFSVFSFAALFLIIYNVLTSVPLFHYDAREWGIFLLLAIFPTVAHVIFNWLLNYINTTTVSMSVLGEPVGASILAVILLGEKLTTWQIIGGIFVIISVFLYLLRQRQPVTLQ